MYGFIFGLFSLAVVLLYGMLHTFYLVTKLSDESDDKRKYIKYGFTLGFSSLISFVLGSIVYFYGVG